MLNCLEYKRQIVYCEICLFIHFQFGLVEVHCKKCKHKICGTERMRMIRPIQ